MSSLWSTRPSRLGLAAIALTAACAAPATNSSGYDVIIANGKIVDGTGNSWYYGDLGIRGDRIAAVVRAGVLDSAAATTRIDARGRVIAPGFIDIQSHSWNQLLFADGRVLSKVTQGVTSEILGEATTPAPSNANIDSLYQPNDPDDAKMRAEVAKFRGEHGFDAWLDAMEAHGISVNAGSYLGATTVRAYVMGQRPGEPDESGLDTMRVIVRNAMRDGAFGISSSLIYPPAAYTSTRELIEIAKAMAPYRGSYITHMRSEDDSLFAAMDEAFRIGREGNVRVDIYHLKASLRRNWSKAPAMVAKIDSVRAAGLDVAATMYPYPFSGNNLGECFPDWAAEGGKIQDNLKNAETRQRILREMTDLRGAPLCQLEGPTAYMIANFKQPQYAKYEGKMLSDIAQDLGQPWAETIVELISTEGRDLSKINFVMSEDNVRMQLKQPWVVIGTDAGGENPDSATSVVHPRAYGTYPRILGRYVREQKLLTLEDAVRKMSSGVAARLGMRDRGLLLEGMFADIVVFDENTIIDLATPEKPHQLSRGVEHVFVNGVQVLRDGAHTGAKPGRALRGPGHLMN
jgi:dihydroorotase/N-acyl-D-amino-acid deacylase